MDFALNNLQRFVCHKTHPNNQPTMKFVFLCVNSGGVDTRTY